VSPSGPRLPDIPAPNMSTSAPPPPVTPPPAWSGAAAPNVAGIFGGGSSQS
jgi:hypothetical protein